jgi:hypothetical protein
MKPGYVGIPSQDKPLLGGVTTPCIYYMYEIHGDVSLIHCILHRSVELSALRK